MPGPVISLWAAEPTDEGARAFVEEATTPIALRAFEPRALALLSSERPLLLELDDLGLTVEGNDDLGSAQTTDAQYGVVFQKLAVLPFPFPPSATCSERRDHRGEINLREGGLY